MNGCGTIYGITPQQIHEAMRMLVEAQGYYKKLSAMAPNEEQEGILNKAMTENADSYIILKKLYKSITCTTPSDYPINLPDIRTYYEGLVQLKAIERRNLSYFLGLWTSVTDIFYTTSITNIRTVVGIPANRAYLHIIYLLYILNLYLCAQ